MPEMVRSISRDRLSKRWNHLSREAQRDHAPCAPPHPRDLLGTLAPRATPGLRLRGVHVAAGSASLAARDDVQARESTSGRRQVGLRSGRCRLSPALPLVPASLPRRGPRGDSRRAIALFPAACWSGSTVPAASETSGSGMPSAGTLSAAFLASRYSARLRGRARTSPDSRRTGFTGALPCRLSRFSTEASSSRHRSHKAIDTGKEIAMKCPGLLGTVALGRLTPNHQASIDDPAGC